MKADVKIERWSARRDLYRRDAMIFRLSVEERGRLDREAAQRLVRPSDIIRGALIYAGVFERPPVTPDGAGERERPPACADGTGPGEDGVGQGICDGLAPAPQDKGEDAPQDKGGEE